MRVGFADAKFKYPIILVSLFAILYLAFWVNRGIPETKWRLVYFLVIYFVAAVLYLNLGVWMHEQLHCLAFRGTVHEKQLHIIFERKFFLALNGHYWVGGQIDYRTLKRALLNPLIMVVGFLMVGWFGSLLLPGWWFPLLATLAVVVVFDMVHDFYWLAQIRSIGEKGKYRDNGQELEVVWKA